MCSYIGSCVYVYLFLFKQKTAYEMRIIDWSSDVCSSDLAFSSGPDAPATTMMLAMIAIAERPPAERAAWRAFFDHYVFRPNGHPLAHLPEERHGILGPLAKGNYGRIRAFVMQMLRGG